MLYNDIVVGSWDEAV